MEGEPVVSCTEVLQEPQQENRNRLLVYAF